MLMNIRLARTVTASECPSPGLRAPMSAVGAVKRRLGSPQGGRQAPASLSRVAARRPGENGSSLAAGAAGSAGRRSLRERVLGVIREHPADRLVFRGEHARESSGGEMSEHSVLETSHVDMRAGRRAAALALLQRLDQRGRVSRREEVEDRDGGSDAHAAAAGTTRADVLAAIADLFPSWVVPVDVLWSIHSMGFVSIDEVLSRRLQVGALAGMDSQQSLADLSHAFHENEACIVGSQQQKHVVSALQYLLSVGSDSRVLSTRGGRLVRERARAVVVQAMSVNRACTQACKSGVISAIISCVLSSVTSDSADWLLPEWAAATTQSEDTAATLRRIAVDVLLAAGDAALSRVLLNSTKVEALRWWASNIIAGLVDVGDNDDTSAAASRATTSFAASFLEDVSCQLRGRLLEDKISDLSHVVNMCANICSVFGRSRPERYAETIIKALDGFADGTASSSAIVAMVAHMEATVPTDPAWQLRAHLAVVRRLGIVGRQCRDFAALVETRLSDFGGPAGPVVPAVTRKGVALVRKAIHTAQSGKRIIPSWFSEACMFKTSQWTTDILPALLGKWTDSDVEESAESRADLAGRLAFARRVMEARMITSEQFGTLAEEIELHEPPTFDGTLHPVDSLNAAFARIGEFVLPLLERNGLLSAADALQCSTIARNALRDCKRGFSRVYNTTDQHELERRDGDMAAVSQIVLSQVVVLLRDAVANNMRAVQLFSVVMPILEAAADWKQLHAVLLRDVTQWLCETGSELSALHRASLACAVACLSVCEESRESNVSIHLLDKLFYELDSPAVFCDNVLFVCELVVWLCEAKSSGHRCSAAAANLIHALASRLQWTQQLCHAFRACEPAGAGSLMTSACDALDTTCSSVGVGVADGSSINGLPMLDALRLAGQTTAGSMGASVATTTMSTAYAHTFTRVVHGGDATLASEETASSFLALLQRMTTCAPGCTGECLTGGADVATWDALNEHVRRLARSCAPQLLRAVCQCCEVSLVDITIEMLGRNGAGCKQYTIITCMALVELQAFTWIPRAGSILPFIGAVYACAPWPMAFLQELILRVVAPRVEELKKHAFMLAVLSHGVGQELLRHWQRGAPLLADSLQLLPDGNAIASGIKAALTTTRDREKSPWNVHFHVDVVRMQLVPTSSVLSATGVLPDSPSPACVLALLQRCNESDPASTFVKTQALDLWGTETRTCINSLHSIEDGRCVLGFIGLIAGADLQTRSAATDSETQAGYAASGIAKAFCTSMDTLHHTPSLILSHIDDQRRALATLCALWHVPLASALPEAIRTDGRKLDGPTHSRLEKHVLALAKS